MLRHNVLVWSEYAHVGLSFGQDVAGVMERLDGNNSNGCDDSGNQDSNKCAIQSHLVPFPLKDCAVPYIG